MVTFDIGFSQKKTFKKQMPYKIINSFNIKVICTVIFFLASKNSAAQNDSLNKYGLQVINEVAIYKKNIQQNAALEMILLKNLIPHLSIELRYAANNNFLNQKLYTKLADAYLRKPAAVALAAIQKELNTKGLGLKIFDAYRPYSITEKIWEAVKDDRYAADPKKGSGHNRGIAVDLTIVDLKNNIELNMGTGFDNFTDSAHHNFILFSKEIIDNRILLKTTMEKYGFAAFDTEWWHYSLPNAINYPLMNIEFGLLKKIGIVSYPLKGNKNF